MFASRVSRFYFRKFLAANSGDICKIGRDGEKSEIETIIEKHALRDLRFSAKFAQVTFARRESSIIDVGVFSAETIHNSGAR
jgi:hypothetical protein